VAKTLVRVGWAWRRIESVPADNTQRGGHQRQACRCMNATSARSWTCTPVCVGGASTASAGEEEGDGRYQAAAKLERRRQRAISRHSATSRKMTLRAKGSARRLALWKSNPLSLPLLAKISAIARKLGQQTANTIAMKLDISISVSLWRNSHNGISEAQAASAAAA